MPKLAGAKTAQTQQKGWAQAQVNKLAAAFDW